MTKKLNGNEITLGITIERREEITRQQIEYEIMMFQLLEQIKEDWIDLDFRDIEDITKLKNKVFELASKLSTYEKLAILDKKYGKEQAEITGNRNYLL
jgi:cell fate (sporulation/competence/biofilm development) regulator YmcA (YheA/YmcA/DUF963 family)